MKKSLCFISIIPPTNICEVIKMHQKVISEQYESHKAFNHKTHITLVPPFFIESSKEDELKSIIKKYSSEIEKFSILINGFSHFKKHTIFAEIKMSDELYELQDNLIKLLNKREGLLLKKINYFQKFRPHITIGYKDLESNFRPAWEYFDDQMINEEFEYNSISILKRGSKVWDVI